MSTQTSTRCVERWRFSASYRLGLHWQQTGDYVRAYAAYAQARRDYARAYPELARRKDDRREHAPTLYNLAVVQVRLGFYAAATESLDALCELKGLPRRPDADEWPGDLLPVAYQRALILDYEGEVKAAADWSGALARRAGEEKPALRLPSLMLHAGILVRRGAGTRLPARTARAVLEGPRDRDLVLDDPAAIFAHVRHRAGADTRTHYNLACFLSRLASLAPRTDAGKLVALAVNEAEYAMSDANLIAWSKLDPALAPVRPDGRWHEMMQRVDAEPPAAAAPAPEAPVDRPAAAVRPSRPAVRSDRDRVRTIDRAVETVRDVCAAERDPSALARLDALRPRAAGLSARRFEIELAAAVAAAGDPATVYHLPVAPGAETMRLPLVVEELAGRHGGSAFVVADGPYTGAVLSHWNGVPIAEAVELRAERMAAPTDDARRARALASLTHRPAGLLAPFAEDEVTVGLDERDVTLAWSPVADCGTRRRRAELWSVDPLVEGIARAREPLEAVEAPPAVGAAEPAVSHLRIPGLALSAAELARRLDERGPGEAGLVVDLRGNPGGSVEAATWLLAALGVEPPRRLELRATPAARRLVEALELPWAPDIDRARRAGRAYAGVTLEVAVPPAEPFTGPVAVLVDALCAGAAAVVALQFAAAGRGPVLSTVPRPGLTAGLSAPVDRTASEPLGWLSTTFARFAGFAAPFAPTHVHRPETTGDEELLAAAAGLLRRPG